MYGLIYIFWSHDPNLNLWKGSQPPSTWSNVADVDPGVLVGEQPGADQPPPAGGGDGKDTSSSNGAMNIMSEC